MSEHRGYKLETLAIHGGQTPDPTTGARAVPIYQTTAYVFQNTDHARQLFALDEPGNIYTRLGNPTQDVFEKRIALLEGGVGAVAFASGHAAIVAAIMTICSAGDEIVSSANLYGGTFNLFKLTLARYGVTTTFVDPTDPENFRKAITAQTKLVFTEVIGNPRLAMTDLQAVADIAHAAGVPFMVDSTFTTPHLCRPIDFGADIVMHSATKWIGGHGTAMGGVIVDGGRFNWANGKFPGFVEPDPSYHGLSYAKDFGSLAFMTKLRVQTLRDLGAAISPFNSFLLLQGLETLPLRMERHSDNAQKVAEFLANHPGVEWVVYPGLANFAQKELAQKQLRNGFGGMIVFGIKGGVSAGETFIESLALFSHVANVGDARSLVIHPASTTHSQLNPEERLLAGVGEDLVRLSIGLEHVEDIIADLDQAIHAATGLSAFVADKGQEMANIVNDEGVIRWVLDSPYVVEEVAGKLERRPKVLAVVGLSSNPGRPSFRVSRKMQRIGYQIVPVNPKEEYVLGEKAYKTLAEIPFPVDVVQVFRASDAAVEVAAETLKMPGAPRVFWLQEGVINEDAVKLTVGAGIRTVHNRCTYKEVQRLKGTLATFKSV